MVTQRATRKVYEVTMNILNIIASDLQASSSKAYLASLRQSIKRDIHWSTGVLPLVFANIPDEYLGKSAELTPVELSIITTLQLFALHQQGKEQFVHSQYDPKSRDRLNNIGASLSILRAKDESQAVDRRFNTMITSTSFSELVTHLRHMIKLLKSKSEAKVDYAQLAQDLYTFQIGYQNSIRLKWARAYFRHYKDQEGDENNERE
jgi:CRISPR system Cascade subunit CasB